MVAATSRPARVHIDVEAIRHNVATLSALVQPSVMCAVVKADAYGHGAISAARAAIAGGARWLAVAVVDEGLALRSAGIDVPILLLSEPPAEAMEDAQGGWLTPTLYTVAGVQAAARVARRGHRPWPVHVKVNTGMNRVGADPADVVDLARRVAESPTLVLEGMWTHLAVADEPERLETADQLEALGRAVRAVREAGIRPEMLHVANSAAALVHPATRLDMVRCGVAIYGVAPAPGLADGLDLRPAMTVCAAVSFVKRVRAGEKISYGLRATFERDTTVATVPIGYADGVSRRLGETGGQVLLGGRRHDIVGSITMDQIMVDCGDHPVAVGDEVVLLGAQGQERILADEWAARLGTIPYEVVCGFGPRLPRVVEEPAQPPVVVSARRTVTVVSPR